MSYRNTVITEFLYHDKEERERIADALGAIMTPAWFGEHVIYGVCKTGTPDSLKSGEEFIRLARELADAQVPPFSLAVVGESEDECGLLQWRGYDLVWKGVSEWAQ